MTRRLAVRTALASVGVGVALFALAGPAAANGNMGGGMPPSGGGCSSCGGSTATTQPTSTGGTITIKPSTPPPPHTYTTPPPIVRSTPQPQPHNTPRPQTRPTPRPASPPTTEAPAEPWYTADAAPSAPEPAKNPQLGLSAQPAASTTPVLQATPSSNESSKGGSLPVGPIVAGALAVAALGVGASALTGGKAAVTAAQAQAVPPAYGLGVLQEAVPVYPPASY